MEGKPSPAPRAVTPGKATLLTSWGGRELAIQEVLSRDRTPPPPEQESGLFFRTKEDVGRGNHSPLSALRIVAVCHHPSSSPTYSIFRVCLPHLAPAYSFFGWQGPPSRSSPGGTAETGAVPGAASPALSYSSAPSPASDGKWHRDSTRSRRTTQCLLRGGWEQLHLVRHWSRLLPPNCSLPPLTYQFTPPPPTQIHWQ